MCFLWFYADINPTLLIRNVQYLVLMAFGIFFVEDDHKAQGCPRRTWADHVKRGVQAERNQQGIGVQRLHPQQKGPVHCCMLKSCDYKLSHMKS